MWLLTIYKFSFSASLSKLLVRLPALRLMSAAVTEELFFAGLIGNVQIDSIIPYILKMESTDYNSQPISNAEWLKRRPQPHPSALKSQWLCSLRPFGPKQRSLWYNHTVWLRKSFLLWLCFFIWPVIMSIGYVVWIKWITATAAIGSFGLLLYCCTYV